MCINLFISIYFESNPQRSNEIISCLKSNLDNEYISNVYVLKEGNFTFEIYNNKLNIINISNRPKFRDFFDIINSITTKDDINILANNDIFFNNTIKLTYKYLSHNKCFALSRWDLINEIYRINTVSSSQDSWIFKGFIKEEINADFYQGIWGCDNKLAYEIKRCGYKIMNPAFSIQSFHVHSSNKRNYRQHLELEGPFHDIIPDSFDPILKLVIASFKNENQ
jgi:hypothetical protein